jgi:hypothetical protein
MKRLMKVGILIAIITGAAGLAQSPLAGAWKATHNGLPVVDLTIRNDGGKLSGTAVFYLIVRNPDDAAAHVGGKMSAPMVNLQGDANTLTFDVHRKDGSVASFRVELRPNGDAKLFRTNDDAGVQSNGRPGPPRDGVDMVREQ